MEATKEALGFVRQAIASLEPEVAGALNFAACTAYFDLIDARSKLRQALAKAEPVSEDKTEVITDSDYNLRGF